MHMTGNVEVPRLPSRGIFGVALAMTAAGLILLWPGVWTGLTSTQFLPHGYCYLWNPRLLWMNVSTDILIWASYVAISTTLVVLAFKARQNIPFQWVYLAFGAFIIACGFTHLMEVVVLWKPVYWISVAVKVITAVASVATAVVIPPLVPKTIDLLESARVSNTRKDQLEGLKTKLLAQKAANMGSWEWEIAGGIVNWSDEMAALYGIAPSEFDHQFSTFIQHVHADDREAVSAALLEAVDKPRELDIEFRTLWPDGTIHWIAARGEVLSNEVDHQMKMIGIAMDISRSKMAEAALRKSEKLAAAGRLSATIAHEINNPLASVTNLLYLARRKDSVADVNKYLEAADSELKRITHIANQTLGFYRESSVATRFSIGTLLDDVFRLLSRKIDIKALKVERLYQQPDEIEAFEGEIRQIFSNIIANAIDASKQGGILRASISSATVHEKPGIRVDIQDFGPGILPKHASEIFEPFFTTKQDIGTGLGLWLAKDLVSKNGGDILLTTEHQGVSTGSIFSVLLPLSGSDGKIDQLTDAFHDLNA